MMPGELLFDHKSLEGAYDREYAPSNRRMGLWFAHPEFGFLMSLNFRGENVFFDPVELDLTVEEGDQSYSGTVPGRFTPPRPSFLGEPIPIQIYFLLPIEWEMTEQRIKISVISIHSISRATGPSIFDGFKVYD